jgi:excisionase family DNA binding protein
MEVTAPQAADLLGVSLPTIHRYVAAGKLPARQQGAGSRQYVYVELGALRTFASQYGYVFNEQMASELQK